MVGEPLYCEPECKFCPKLHESVLKLNRLIEHTAVAVRGLAALEFGVITRHDIHQADALVIGIKSLRHANTEIEFFVKGESLIPNREEERKRLRYEVLWKNNFVVRGWLLPFEPAMTDDDIRGAIQDYIQLFVPSMAGHLHAPPPPPQPVPQEEGLVDALGCFPPDF
jgi:hypothetical protein